MTEGIEYWAQLRKVGTSLAVLVPKMFIDDLKLAEGDTLLVKVNGVSKEEKQHREFRALHKFAGFNGKLFLANTNIEVGHVKSAYFDAFDLKYFEGFGKDAKESVIRGASGVIDGGLDKSKLGKAGFLNIANHYIDIDMGIEASDRNGVKRDFVIRFQYKGSDGLYLNFHHFSHGRRIKEELIK